MLDESPKWLLATGQRKKADDLLRNIARYNETAYNEDDLLEKEKAIETEQAATIPLQIVWHNYVRNPATLLFLLITVFAWLVVMSNRQSKPVLTVPFLRLKLEINVCPNQNRGKCTKSPS